MGAQNANCTMKFIDIPEDRQREAINTVALQSGLPPSSIEKDWWVTQVLKALHALPYAEHIAFKGGTCLSKCWNLIGQILRRHRYCTQQRIPWFLRRIVEDPNQRQITSCSLLIRKR